MCSDRVLGLSCSSPGLNSSAIQSTASALMRGFRCARFGLGCTLERGFNCARRILFETVSVPAIVVYDPRIQINRLVPRRAKQIKLGPEPIQANKNLPGINGRRGARWNCSCMGPPPSREQRGRSIAIGAAGVASGAAGEGGRRAWRGGRTRGEGSASNAYRGYSASAWHGMAWP
jgi:hypothetical protein